MARRDFAAGELMRLGLSSAAAPDAPFEELIAACRRRGLVALELAQGGAHGFGFDDIEASVRLAAEADGVEVSGFRMHSAGAPNEVARLTKATGVPAVIAFDDEPAARMRYAQQVAEAGGHALVMLRHDEPLRYAEAFASAGLRLSWEVDPMRVPIPAAHERGPIRLAALHDIRLIGGGPEIATLEGRGVDALLRDMALAAWSGFVIIAPSSPRFRVIWETWLGRRGGWGCGTAAEKQAKRSPTTVALNGEQQ